MHKSTGAAFALTMLAIASAADALTFKKGEVLSSDGTMKPVGEQPSGSIVSDPTKFWEKAKAAKKCLSSEFRHIPDKIKIKKIKIQDSTFSKLKYPLGLNGGSNCKFGIVSEEVPAPLVDAKITSVYGGQDNEIFHTYYQFLNTNIGANRLKPQSIARNRLKSFLISWSSKDALKKNIRFKLMDDFRLDFHVQSLIPTMIIAYSDVSGSMTVSERVQVGRWLNRLVEQSQKSKFPSRQDNKSYLRHLTALLWGIVIGHDGLIDQARLGYQNAIFDMRPDGTFPTDVARGGSGIQYQNFATSTLLSMAGYATIIGENWIDYEVNGRSLKDAALWTDRAAQDPSMNKIYARQCDGGSYDTIDKPNMYHLESEKTGESGSSWVPLYTILTGESLAYLSDQLQTSRGYWSKSYGPQACVVKKTLPARPTLTDVENEIKFSQPKRVWDIRFEGIKQVNDGVIGAATIGTIIKQHLPVRNFEVHFQVVPENGIGRFALVKGVSNDGMLDGIGNKISFALNATLAEKIKTTCSVELYEKNGEFFPTFELKDVMQTISKNSPVTGLSEQTLCQIEEYGRYNFVDMVNILGLVAKGLKGQVEDKIHADDPKTMKLLQGFRLAG